MPSSDGLLVIDIKAETKYKFHASATLLLRCSKVTLPEVAYFV